MHGSEPRSSGGNTSSNPQVSALFPRPAFNGMERMCQRHGSNKRSHPPVPVRKPLCNQFIHNHISSRGVFSINRFKLYNFAVVAIECSFATVYRGSIMARIHRCSRNLILNALHSMFITVCFMELLFANSLLYYSGLWNDTSVLLLGKWIPHHKGLILRRALNMFVADALLQDFWHASGWSYIYTRNRWLYILIVWLIYHPRLIACVIE